MTIDEIREKKHEVEMEIAKSLAVFEQETGMDVEDVYLHHVTGPMGRRVTAVRLDVRLRS